MKAILINEKRCALRDNVAIPTLQPHEVLIRVHYAGVNRADLFQKAGSYPPPAGASEILGLECSGEISAIGTAVTSWKVGDRVCALLEGGGYAEYACCAASQCLPIPDGWSVREAGVLPEALFTVWLALFHTARLQAGESLLVHGAAGGIGSMALQMAKAAGAHPVATAGSEAKTAFCRSHGAELALNYRDQPTVEAMVATLKATYPDGMNVILDYVGADYFQANLSLLAKGGRMVSLAFLSGAKTAVNVAPLLFKQASWHGLTLRSRSTAEKAILTQEIKEHCWEWLEKKQVMPTIDAEFSLHNAEKAHEKMQQNLNLGKILLQVAPE